MAMLSRGIAHDFNNALTSIIGQTQQLEAALAPHRDCTSALALLDEWKGNVDAVLLEWSGSRTDEYELLATIGESSPEAPVLLMNGAGAADTAKIASREGVFFIGEPLDPNQLLGRLRYAMGHVSFGS